MLHLPMEPEPDAHMSPGEGAILVGMKSGEVQRVVQDDLAAVPYVAGVNNHMGSRATQDAALMDDVMRTSGRPPALLHRQPHHGRQCGTGGGTAANTCRRFTGPCFWTIRKRSNTRCGSWASSAAGWKTPGWHSPSGIRTPPPLPRWRNSCRNWNGRTSNGATFHDRPAARRHAPRTPRKHELIILILPPPWHEAGCRESIAESSGIASLIRCRASAGRRCAWPGNRPRCRRCRWAAWA